jgi:hypothetical protein
LFLGTGINWCSAQNKRIDTTVTIGRSGYRVSSTNKNPDKNVVTISPQGFESEAHEMSFYAGGIVTKAVIDDLNNDGFPDLLLYIYAAGNKGSVLAVVSKENKSLVPVFFPDIMNDMKLRVGYKGHDEFSMLEGSIMRKFPIYKTEDTDTPTGGKRIIQYRMMTTENGGFKFSVERSYEVK